MRLGKFDYARYIYRFRDILEGLFGCPLERLHEKHILFRPVSRETDQQTPFHHKFYGAFKAVFNEPYKRFVRDEVLPAVGEDCVYQRIPTLRIQYPDNLAVGEFHKDTDYNHPAEGRNVFVPLTVARETSTIWIREGYAAKPMDACYGEAVVWDGANRRHGNYPNRTGYTRVSLDLRLIPITQYRPQPDRKTVNTGMALAVGDYYDRMP